MSELTLKDFCFDKKPEAKCKHCGKTKAEHLAKTHHCPTGPKHRTLGYLSYDKTLTFEAKPARAAKKGQ